MSEDLDEKALMLLKDAFKRFLTEQLGPLEDKPPIELWAWSLALIELASVVRLHLLKFEDGLSKSEAKQNV